MSIKKGYKVIAGAPLEAVWGNISGDIADQADLQAALAEKVGANSPAFTGTPTAPTPPTGSYDDRIATTSYVQQAIESVDGLPSQAGHSGQYLTTNGTSASWGTVNALPSQSGQTGKFLTTNGTTASWSSLPEELPSQTGNDNKFLKTNGTSVSWSPALVNESTGTDSLSILAGEITSDNNISIGIGAWGSEYTLAIGNTSYAYHGGAISIGHGASAINGSIAIGNGTEALSNAENSIVIGQGAAVTASYGIQLGFGNCSESNTFYVGLSSTHNYKLLDSNGKIPDARLNNPIPSQIAQSGKFLTTNGTTISWEDIPSELPDQSGQDGKFLTTDGSEASWEDIPTEIPSQSGQNGKFLTTNGTSVSWATVDALPTQAGNANKFLTTDGTNASWADVDALPSQSGQSGKFLTTNGTTASWSDIEDNKSITKNSSNKLQTVGTIDQNNTSNAIKVWTGTKAQYEAITTKDANTIYNITDDASDQVVAHTNLNNLTPEGKNIANWSTNTTNCITEIPQDIKLELNNGTLTLKAGSKVYIPNGNGTFDSYTLTEDKTATDGSSDKTMLVFYYPSGGYISKTDINECKSGTTQPTVSEWGFWYDTTNNSVKRYLSGSFVGGYSLPIAIIKVSDGAITSIEQVFNGFGYIDSTVFALPGVKGLIPNGRNNDGTLKNTEFTLDSVKTVTAANNTYLSTLALYLNKAINTTDSIYEIYDIQNNIFYTGSTHVQSMCFGYAYITNGKITSFIPKTTFHAVDYNDMTSILDIMYPVGSIYIGTQSTCPMSAFFGTWVLKGTKILTDVSGSNSVPVKGTGKALGLTNGTYNAGLGYYHGGSTLAASISTNSYNSNVGSSFHYTESGESTAWGVSTDSTKSGIVADISSSLTKSSLTVNIWERTA